jgi:hypothetical protein
MQGGSGSVVVLVVFPRSAVSRQDEDEQGEQAEKAEQFSHRWIF